MKNTRNVADLEHIETVLQSIVDRLRDQIEVEYQLRDYEAIEDELASSRTPQFEHNTRIGIIFDAATNLDVMEQINVTDEYKRRRDEILTSTWNATEELELSDSIMTIDYLIG